MDGSLSNTKEIKKIYIYSNKKSFQNHHKLWISPKYQQNIEQKWVSQNKDKSTKQALGDLGHSKISNKAKVQTMNPCKKKKKKKNYSINIFNDK
jgi:hypothetical protein